MTDISRLSHLAKVTQPVPAMSQAALLGGNSLIPHDGLLVYVLEGRPLQLLG